MHYVKYLPGIILLVILALLSACGGGGGGGSSVEEHPCDNDGSPIPGPSAPSGNSFDNVMNAFEVHPSNPNQFWLGTEENGILLGTYAGGTITWVRQRIGLRHCRGTYTEIFDIAVSTADPQVLLAAGNSGQGTLNPSTERTNPGGIYYSSDSGFSWTRRNTGIPQSSVASVEFLPGSTVDVWASTQSGTSNEGHKDGQMYYATDGGLNWNPVSGTEMVSAKALFKKILVRGPSPPYTFYAVGRDVFDPLDNLGVLVSTDGSGIAFNPVSGNFSIRTNIFGGHDVTLDGTIIYVLTDSNDLLRSMDSGANWETFSASGNNALAVSPVDPDIVITGGAGPSAPIFRSTNATSASPTFRLVHTTDSIAPFGHIDVIEFSPSDPNIVFAVTKGYLTYRSEDSGATWFLPTNGDARTWINSNP
jgi:hypothetical protein